MFGLHSMSLSSHPGSAARPSPTIVWFRRDLRIADNPALHAAVERGHPVVPLFVWAPEEDGLWRPGDATRWWLRRSLQQFSEDLAVRGSELIMMRGATIEVIDKVRRSTGADTVVWNRRYEPAAIEVERRLEQHLAKAGIHTRNFEGTLLSSDRILSSAGQPFRRFTPFYNAFMANAAVDEPLEPVRSIRSSDYKLSDDAGRRVLEAIDSAPKRRDWAPSESWEPGSNSANSRMCHFVRDDLAGYADRHDRMDQSGTSRLSPHLTFGEISTRQAWHAARNAAKSSGNTAFLRQLIWREFAYHQLIQFPQITDTPLKPEFARLETHMNQDAFRAWTTGHTGYPIVDAGMRELSASGWMHNRARMVVASFLIKHLALPWQVGAHWFWDNLVDADLASNSLNWQWVAGSAVDASPYYRIFNPTRQGERFDPDGNYVRLWVRELASLPAPRIHTPWKNVTGPRPYPDPIVDHDTARKAALERYGSVRLMRNGD